MTAIERYIGRSWIPPNQQLYRLVSGLKCSGTQWLCAWRLCWISLKVTPSETAAASSPIRGIGKLEVTLLLRSKQVIGSDWLKNKSSAEGGGLNVQFHAVYIQKVHLQGTHEAIQSIADACDWHKPSNAHLTVKNQSWLHIITNGLQVRARDLGERGGLSS